MGVESNLQRKTRREISGEKGPRPREPRVVLVLGTQRQPGWVQEKQVMVRVTGHNNQVLGTRKGWL